MKENCISTLCSQRALQQTTILVAALILVLHWFMHGFFKVEIV